VDYRLWAAWNPDHSALAAYGLVIMLRTEENQHMAQLEIGVMPEWRRQGIGTRLLALSAAATAAAGRRLLIGVTSDKIPAGAAFMSALGARMGLESHENQLDLNDLDRGLIAGWIARGEERNPDMQLGEWGDTYPEDEIEAISRLLDSANDAPRGDLDMEDMHQTPEQLRQQEEYRRQSGAESWTMYIRDRTNGELAGFTTVFWNPDKPTMLTQGYTAVWQKYRNRGLGRWLKAAMLDKVLRERPQVRYVRTGNADSNAPMLKINYELGFKPHLAEAVWQVDLANVQEYLARKGL
jgi:mycothiol synthase